MINVNHKIKCTHEGTPILRYIKKKSYRLQTVHAYHNISSGKAGEGFLVNTHCHDKNNYVQTARSLIAVNSLYTERCHYLIKYTREWIPRVHSTEQ